MHLLAERFVFWEWRSGISERRSQDLSNGTNVASWIANIRSVFTSVVYIPPINQWVNTNLFLVVDLGPDAKIRAVVGDLLGAHVDQDGVRVGVGHAGGEHLDVDRVEPGVEVRDVPPLLNLHSQPQPRTDANNRWVTLDYTSQVPYALILIFQNYTHSQTLNSQNFLFAFSQHLIPLLFAFSKIGSWRSSIHFCFLKTSVCFLNIWSLFRLLSQRLVPQNFLSAFSKLLFFFLRIWCLFLLLSRNFIPQKFLFFCFLKTWFSFSWLS